MIKNKFYLITTAILVISLLVSSIIIATSLNNISEELHKLKVLEKQSEKNILTLEEAAEYLGIRPETLEDVIETTSVGIPYLKLEHKYIFTKRGLDKWLESNYIDLDY